MKREGQIKVHSENIFPIIKKWLYSDKDIFLRELVSNGCDAIKKLEKLKLIGEFSGEIVPKLTIVVDAEKKILTVEDNGLGMTEEEVEKYITQIAFSGAEEFIEKYKNQTDGEAGIIGHFGLGFYSAFMVSDTVEIDTCSYQEDAKPVHWVSDGSDSYEISDGDRTERGTRITLHISEEEKEFLEESRIRTMLRKYCAFMPYEIYLNPKEEQEVKEEGNGEENAPPVSNYPVNNIHPLWQKAPKDCTDEEYKQFYSQVFMDFQEPLFWIHLNVDYPFNLKGILYFPKLSNKVEVMPGEIKLYSNQVYVADNIKEVVPEFLMLLKGVIDCPDLPLNVSRSFLQNDGDVQKIAKHITKKVSDKLHSIFKESRENYQKYWEDIAPFLKFGCIKDESFYERVKDILLLKNLEGEYKTLEEYPKTEDKKIFYVTDENLQSQYIRMFKEQGLSAAILDHMIDSHFISFLEYKEPELKFARIDSDISASMKESESQESAEGKEELVKLFKKALDNADLDVKAESLKTKETPAVILLSEQSRRMQDMGSMYGMSFGAMKPEISVILNRENKIIQAVSKLDPESPKLELVCRYVYDLAMMNHRPLTAEEMAAFMKRSTEILEIVAEK